MSTVTLHLVYFYLHIFTFLAQHRRFVFYSGPDWEPEKTSRQRASRESEQGDRDTQPSQARELVLASSLTQRSDEDGMYCIVVA